MRRRSSWSSRRPAASSCSLTRSRPVHEICRRLDGLPLAIELVAARLVVLPPGEILRALADGLALEMEGPVDLPERQRTLRAAIDWSYERLTEEQRAVHSAFAVFADGAALDDLRARSRRRTRAFCPDLEALVAWSLVRSDVADGGVRVSRCSRPSARTRSTDCVSGWLHGRAADPPR